MYFPSSSVLLALSIASTSASPAPTAPSSAPAAAQPSILNRRSTNNCNGDGRIKVIEAQAWADHKALAAAVVNWPAHHDLLDYWLGNDTRSLPIDLSDQLATTLKREFSVHTPNWLLPESVIDVYCGDTYPGKQICVLKNDPNDPSRKVTPFASSWVERGIFWNNYNIILCPRFFEEKFSLQELLQDMKDGKRDPKNASEYKNSWAHTYYHELAHLDPAITQEETVDTAYYACPVHKLAYQNGFNGAINWIPERWRPSMGPANSIRNADSWAFFASGGYFQRAMSLTEPGKAPDDSCNTTKGGDDRKNKPSVDPLGDGPEGILYPAENRTGDSYNARTPPEPAPENTPPEDPPTPAMPYNGQKGQALPSGLARPFNASAYFASYNTTSTGPPAPTCTGDQVEGSCTMGQLPSATPDNGPTEPVCNKADSPEDDYVMFNDTQARGGVTDYCQDLISMKTVLSADNKNAPAPGTVNGAAEKGGYISIEVIFDAPSCDPGTKGEDQKLDFGEMQQATCEMYFDAIVQACAKDKTWTDYNADFSIEGGTYGASCAMWSMSGLPSA